MESMAHLRPPRPVEVGRCNNRIAPHQAADPPGLGLDYEKNLRFGPPRSYAASTPSRPSRPHPKINRRRLRSRLTGALVTLVAPSAAIIVNPTAAAYADNTRLNNGVFTNIYTAQKMNGCQAAPHWDARLTDAARAHTVDLLGHSEINGDIGSNESTVQDRAQAAGFVGRVSETVAINAALTINGMDVLNQWWYDPASRATMQDCRNTAVGVWSENSLARSVVVAVYGQPADT